MIAELGHFSLILALGMALALAVIPAMGAYGGKESWMQLSRSLSLGLFTFIAISFVCLANSFIGDDFSVTYVAQNSNTALPIQYKISAIWGAHEGSFLLWVLVMAAWTLAVSLFSGGSLDMRARVLSVLGGLSVGFLLFLLLTSNPFARTLPVFPAEGSDLNPLLQDFGLIVHPPLLYMGYVGFAVPFAFAVATLTTGRLDSAWACWSKPWTNLAWAFLTLGIALGSWWAYYELGWGGWWFWDAVENASFMPWLIGTALIHSLVATEKRGVFKRWTVLLAILAFSFSLLGAFLVRSGVLTSVHTFAVDPQRGLVILLFSLLVICSSLLLFAIKATAIKGQSNFEIGSRETFLLANNLLLIVAAAAVLIGTIFPIVYEAANGGGKISVGPPYFNFVFVKIMLVLFVLMAMSPLSRWKSTPLEIFKPQWKVAFAALLLAAGLIWVFADGLSIIMLFVVTVALWIGFTLVLDWFARVKFKRNKFIRLFKQSPSYYAMQSGHIGIVVAMLGVVITVTSSEERDVRMATGDVVTLADYDFKLVSVEKRAGPNYIADRGEIEVMFAGKLIATLHPEKRLYRAGGNVMTEADIDPTMFRDLYVALGEPIGEDAWAVRLHYKPFVRWIWFGGLLIAFGGCLALADKRLHRSRRKVSHGAVTSGAAG